jgi:membrane-associated phospholipid phosphatase
MHLLTSVGRVVKQPPFWLLAAGGMALAGGEQGRRAAVRGSACYLATAGVANLVLKPVAHRRRPPGAGPGPFRPLTSSMPSGHAASDTAFAVGAWLEWPATRLPMLALTTASHWSLVRSRSHYVTDILAGDLVGAAVAMLSRRARQPGGGRNGLDSGVERTAPTLGGSSSSTSS